MRPSRAVLVTALAVLTTTAAPAAAGGPTKADLERQLDALVAAEGGPPGAIVTLRRGSHPTVLSAGVAESRRAASRAR